MPFSESEWQDSNLRSQHPKCRAIPPSLHPDILTSHKENTQHRTTVLQKTVSHEHCRTHPFALLCSPDQRLIFCTYSARSVMQSGIYWFLKPTVCGLQNAGLEPASSSLGALPFIELILHLFVFVFPICQHSVYKVTGVHGGIWTHKLCVLSTLHMPILLHGQLCISATNVCDG